MNTDQAREKLLHGELTEKIIGIFYAVYNELGGGFLESVYRNAMVLALRQSGLSCEAEHPVPVHFRGQQIGSFFADVLVEDKIILELKAVRHLETAHEAQLLNYLRATPIEVGLLLNFGARASFRRFRLDNSVKGQREIRVDPCESVSEGFQVSEELVGK
jgi:GxxExxY protein